MISLGIAEAKKTIQRVLMSRLVFPGQQAFSKYACGQMFQQEGLLEAKLRVLRHNERS